MRRPLIEFEKGYYNDYITQKCDRHRNVIKSIRA